MAHNQNYDIPEEEKIMDIEFFTSQDQSFLNCGNDKFFFTRDVWYGEYDKEGKKAIKKQYYSSKTTSHFLDFYNDLPDEEKHFYELLKTDRPRKEYFDLDVKQPNPDREDYTHYDSEEYFNLFCNLRKKFLEFKDIPYIEPDWRITDSSKPADPRNNKPKILSLHCVNLNTTMINQEISCKYFEDFDYFLETHYPEYRGIFDVSVKGGNRNMRLIHSSKYKQNRPLLPAQWHEKSKNAPIIDFIISNVSDKDLKKAITTYNKTVRETNKNKKIQIKQDKKRVEFEENKFQPMALINSDSENKLQEQIENLCELIIYTIKNQTSTLCDSKYPNKLNYENFRNLSFAYVNSIENLDENYNYWLTEIYPIYRHSLDHNPEQIWKSIVRAKEINNRESIFTIKSLHYWAKQHPDYKKLFKRKEKRYSDDEIGKFDINDKTYYWHDFFRQITTIPIWDSISQLQEFFIKNFPRVANSILSGTEQFYLKIDEQNNYQYNKKIDLGTLFIQSEGRPLPINFQNIYNDSRRFFTRYQDIQFQPYDIYSEEKKDPISPLIINTFNGFQAKLIPDYDIPSFSNFDGYETILPILNHIKEVWANDNIDDFKYIISWLANIIKFPNRLNKTMITLISDNEQVGKGIIVEWLLKNIIGLSISGKTGEFENIVGRFNSFIMNKLVIGLDEMNDNETYKNGSWNKFKTYITDEIQTVEIKGIDEKIRIKNYVNYICMTNQAGAIKISQGDKRIAVFNCSDKYSGNRDYFQNLSRCLQDEKSPNLFFTFLYNLPNDIIVDPRDIPNNQAKQDMAKITMDQPRKFLLEIKNGEYELGKSKRINIQYRNDDGETKEEKRYYTFAELYDEFNNWIYSSGERTGRYTSTKFRANIRSSIQRVRVRLDENGNKIGNKSINPVERYDIETINVK